MSKTIDRVIGQVAEMFRYFPRLSAHYVTVSNRTLSTMMIELNGMPHEYRVTKPPACYARGFDSLALQTKHGQLYVLVDDLMDDDDIMLLSSSREEFFYKEHYLNKIVEETVLGREHG